MDKQDRIGKLVIICKCSVYIFILLVVLCDDVCHPVSSPSEVGRSMLRFNFFPFKQASFLSHFCEIMYKYFCCEFSCMHNLFLERVKIKKPVFHNNKCWPHFHLSFDVHLYLC